MPLQGYESGTVLHDRFRLLSEIGEGGAASVFLAHDLAAERIVALKVVREPNGEAANNLIREGEALRAVRHPRVVGFVECGTLHDGRSFLAMQYATGRPLRATLQHGPIAVAHALVLGGAVADALTAIHAAGMIHRDLKPDNIIVPMREGAPIFGEAMLIDLGVYGAMRKRSTDGSAQTRWGRVSGTVWYMAPEQLAGRAQTVATDVYAFGLLLHESIFGTVPLAGEDVRAATDSISGALLAYTGPFVRRRIAEHVVLPEEPRLTPALRSFIRALLHPDPAHRTPCMPEVVRWLRDLRAGETLR
ncbi:MAG TPA: serine/threonine-protein kinase [Gemmatimonadaceae bacterium]